MNKFLQWGLAAGMALWGLAVHAADYYVSPTGTASWTQCQNIATPCGGKTAMLNAQAGDTVYFRGGTYDPAADPVQEWIDANAYGKYEWLPWNPANSGTEGYPITFKAYPGEIVIFLDNTQSGAFGASHRNWIVWDGITATIVDLPSEPIALAVLFESEHSVIRNCKLTGLQKNSHDNSALVWLQKAHHAVVENNVLQGMNDDGNGNADNEEAVNSAAVLNFYSANITVRNNDLINNYYGIWDKATEQNNHFYSNHIWGGDAETMRCRVGVQTSAQNPTLYGEDVRIYQNLIRNCSVGVYVYDSPNPNHRVQIYNNTIYHAGGGHTGVLVSNQSVSASLYNNAVSGYYAIARYFPTLSITVTQSDFNNFYNYGVWAHGYVAEYYTLADWIAGTGLDAHSLTMAPQFVNAGGTRPEDYRLATNSPLRARGLNGQNIGAYLQDSNLIGYQTMTMPPPLPELSTNADLSALSLSAGSLTPAFGPAVTYYSASVGNEVSSLTVTPAVAESHATVSVNGVVIAAGGSSGAINLVVGTNSLTIQVTAQNGAIKTYSVQVTRAALPPPPLPTVGFSASVAVVQENIGILNLTLRRSASNGVTTASYATRPGSATAGEDYAAVTGSVSWGDGENGDKPLYIAINNDIRHETTETFELYLTALSGGVLGAASVTVSLIDDDPVTPPPPPPPPPPPLSSNQGQIQAGTRHSYALTPGGTLYAWGGNSYGQLGTGVNKGSAIPIPVPGMTGLKAIHAGYANLFALRQDGSVWAWGWNVAGQLGLGYSQPYYVRSPQAVTALRDPFTIAPATNYTAVLKVDGTMLGWGQNGTGEGSLTPLSVNGIEHVMQIASGGAFTLALKDDGSVWAWGSNPYGQLGDGTATARATPALIAGLNDIVEVVAGENHALALKADGTVWAWGFNKYGQLGDNSKTSRSSPVQVTGLNGVITIAAAQSGDHSLAVKADGTVWGWGRNGSGQLGDGSSTHRKIPVQINGLANVVQLAAGELHTLALKADGSLWGWGSNASGQLGLAGSSNYTAPVALDFSLVGR